MTYKISIKNFSTTAELNLAREIFDSTWSKDFGTEITPNLLQALVHSGAYVSGAFMDGKCIGAAFAFPATTRGLHLH